MSNIKKVIGIVSGKGGVGKSLVTSLMAAAVQKEGFNCAVLDADITGPSIPKIFGINQKASGNEYGILPMVTSNGTKIMSINLLLENDTDPVVWRGPVIAGTVKQFWTDVIWEDVDCMFVDMPPGTGDVPLTVFQSLPVDGIIIVTSPQELVSMIVEKAVNMAKLMDIPILGVVENMSYAECPTCGEKINIFGESKLQETAKKSGIEALAQIPMKPEIAQKCDAGKVEEVDSSEWLKKAVEAVKGIIKS
jgi:Mrp family chromosome partitioning ATPase